ncbi:hypothetical protein [Neobacillus sp. 19]|uniref:hypothetical protein n=1 Tax=Neobacillus sp. 19 TaxID=3394458 RepID=UPI003BF74A3F
MSRVILTSDQQAKRMKLEELLGLLKDDVEKNEISQFGCLSPPEIARILSKVDG